MRKIVSVVIPTLNNEEEIAGLCESLKRHQDKCELIFIDGYSNDETIKLLNINLHSPVIYKYPARGIYNAYNLGLERATSKYIMFMGADDRLCEGFADICNLLKYSNDDYPLVVCQSIIDPSMLKTNHQKDRFNLISVNFCHQSIIYKKELIIKLKFSEKYTVMADWVVNLELYKKYSEKIQYLDYVISIYKQNGFSGRSKDRRWELMHILLKIKNLNLINIIEYKIKAFLKL
jgi:glycosyltransferase involved in cell wall biosynthesis